MALDKKLVRGSFILLLAFNAFNVLNFAFHFSMARMMDVTDYGVLATLFTIFYILAVFSESIQIVITKYAAKIEDKGIVKNILKRSLKKAFIVSWGILIVYIIFSVFLSKILKIEFPLMALSGLIIFSIFLSPISRGLLQGKQRFRALGVNMVLEAVLKLALAILFVWMGWRVYGAIVGTLIGMFVAFGASFTSLRDIIKSEEKKAKTKEIYGYTKPTFCIMLVILIFYSVDVIIAKIFFSAEIAGVYALAAILAKTIFFGTQPISRAMFPITSDSKNGDKKPENTFGNALVMLSVIVAVALIVFYFFPSLIVRIFSGRYIPEAAKILFYLGIAISFLSFANLILLYKLSTDRIKNYSYLFIFLIGEVFLLSYFSANMFQFSIAFVVASAVFLWGSIFLLDSKPQ